jgi:hypothetical protein
MIIDQSAVDAGSFPRSQRWEQFIPTWVTVTVRPDGFVVLSTPAPEETLRKWIDQFPRIACAVIPPDEAPYGTGGSSSPC